MRRTLESNRCNALLMKLTWTSAERMRMNSIGYVIQCRNALRNNRLMNDENAFVDNTVNPPIVLCISFESGGKKGKQGM